MLPNSPVPLKRSTDHTFSASENHVPLSPSGNVKNIRVICTALRQRSDGDIVRAGYTPNGKPFVEFLRKKSMAVSCDKNAIDVRKQRDEFARILWNTAETASRSFKYATLEQSNAIFLLKMASRSIPIGRDFRVRDIKPYIEILNRAYQQGITKAWQEREIDPYREEPSHRKKIRKQRAKQFLNMAPATRLHLVNSLIRPQDKGPEKAIAAVKAMEEFMRHYLNPKESHREMVRKVKDNEDLQFFCHRWIADHPLSKSKGSIYHSDHKFEPYSWPRLLDLVCPLIVKEHRRHVVLQPRGDSRFGRDGMMFQRSSSQVSTKLPDSAKPEPVHQDPAMQSFLVETMAIRTEPVFSARLCSSDQQTMTESYIVDVMPLEIEPEFVARPVDVVANAQSEDIQH